MPENPPVTPSEDPFEDLAGPSDGDPSRWQRWHGHLHRNRAMSATTKIVVTLVGTLVLGAGLVMMVTPGPGILGIVAGLAILATEWEWAEQWLGSARRKLEEAQEKAAAMDPAVRRRRILLGSGLSVLAAGLVAGYVVVRDWPGWSVSMWNRAQAVLGFLPELPGM